MGVRFRVRVCMNVPRSASVVVTDLLDWGLDIDQGWDYGYMVMVMVRVRVAVRVRVRVQVTRQEKALQGSTRH